MQGQLQQKRAVLSENYLRRENDIAINMLEQELDSREGEAEDAGALHRDRQEIDIQIKRYQQEVATHQTELQLLRTRIEESGADGMDLSQAAVDGELIKKLREKTLEVEDLGMKMDELQSKNEELEILMKKIETFDREVFEVSRKKKTVQQLMREIQDKAAELEAFPRKNRHCVEWFDKYSAKH